MIVFLLIVLVNIVVLKKERLTKHIPKAMLWHELCKIANKIMIIYIIITPQYNSPMITTVSINRSVQFNSNK